MRTFALSPDVRRGAAGMFGDWIITRLRAAELPTDAVPPDDVSLSRATARITRAFRINRVAIGVALILHGLAHSGAGFLLVDPERASRLFDGHASGTFILWLTGMLSAVSMLGFVAGGLGVLGVAGPHQHGRRLVVIAAVASVMLLARAATPYAVAGMALDLAAFMFLGVTDCRSLRGHWVWHRTLLEKTLAPNASRRNRSTK